MENYITRIFLIILLFACGPRDNRSQCIPEIVIETNKDTLTVGETYTAKIYLSDESVLLMTRNGETNPIIPLFRINGEIYESENNYFIYEEEVDGKNLTKSSIKEWSCGIIFPHPVWGDVEISQRNEYFVEIASQL